METNERILIIREKILAGLKESYKKLVEMKRKNKSVIVIYKDGAIVKIKP